MLRPKCPLNMDCGGTFPSTLMLNRPKMAPLAPRLTVCLGMVARLTKLDTMPHEKKDTSIPASAHTRVHQVLGASRQRDQQVHHGYMHGVPNN